MQTITSLFVNVLIVCQIWSDFGLAIASSGHLSLVEIVN